MKGYSFLDFKFGEKICEIINDGSSESYTCSLFSTLKVVLCLIRNLPGCFFDTSFKKFSSFGCLYITNESLQRDVY